MLRNTSAVNVSAFYIFFIIQVCAGNMGRTAGSLSVYKWLTFVSMYVGYTLIVFNRKSFTFALPAIIASLSLDKDDAGKLLSCLCATCHIQNNV